MNKPHQCDFCSDPVTPNDLSAVIYDTEDFTAPEFNLGFKGAWLACATCAAFIRQYDEGLDDKARKNLARRAVEKHRRKYNIRGMGDVEINKILTQEVARLHEAFWANRKDTPPVPYATMKLEG